MFAVRQCAMTHFEKRQAVIAELTLDASRSNRDIARSSKCSEGLVRDVRQELERTGKLLPGKPDRGGRPPKKRQRESELSTPKGEPNPMDMPITIEERHEF